MRLFTLAITCAISAALSYCSPAAVAPDSRLSEKRSTLIGPNNGIPEQDYLDCLYNEVNTCKVFFFPYFLQPFFFY
ncbi:hypothetical protein B0H66DRAFT_568881 [Apodospora peruviana]|uniref:Uncharacterized protein n=1 Tax=Apodospora peruviana TaxID=516989 RepID=A0AAE0HU69_9PEZI|nr:hypothetical protein B0H66DRAFT_568881 [Apodospora peruviana]